MILKEVQINIFAPPEEKLIMPLPESHAASMSFFLLFYKICGQLLNKTEEHKKE